MRIIILDDDEVFMSEFERICVTNIHEISIDKYKKLEDILKLTTADFETISAIFINTVVNSTDTISVISKKFNKSGPPVIYITEFPDRDCETVFLTNTNFSPFAMLRKPLNPDTLNSILYKLIKFSSLARSIIIIKNAPRKCITIPTESIRYVESNKRKIVIHTQDNAFTKYAKLKEFRETLPEYFIMSHNSYLVNYHSIESYDNSNIYIKHGVIIPISKNYRKSFITKINYLRRQP